MVVLVQRRNDRRRNGMSKVVTYDFYEIESGPGGSAWETHINGVLAGTIHDLDGLLRTIGTIIREGHIVHIHTVAEYYAKEEREAVLR
jgi:hypothetical protein